MIKPTLFLLFFLASCGSDGGAREISEESLAGLVAGEPWSFVEGHTSAFLSEGEDDFFAILVSEAFETCGFGEPSGDKLIVSIPKEPGAYNFSLSLNMTFVQGSSNLVATDGQIVVDEVTATRVRGGLTGYFDGDNEVSGQFDIAICAGE